jgi:hypothetical protein
MDFTEYVITTLIQIQHDERTQTRRFYDKR